MSDPGQHTVADAVGERLAALGVDTVFGVIGSGNFVVTEALRRKGARFVAARHECGATMMADGWACVTGRVGVVSVHQGPGLTNTTTGLTEAAKSRTPLLVLAGDTPPAALTSNFRIDQHGLPAAVGAIAERIHSPATAEADAARALRRAQLERRPVVLNLPIDMQPLPAVAAAPATDTPVPLTPAPRDEDVQAAVALLGAADNVAIIAGRGAVLADAGPAIDELALICDAVLATSAVAHGLFADNPRGLGIAGGFASPFAAELLGKADVVLLIGASFNHWTNWHGRLLRQDARVIHVDVDPAAIGANHRVDVAIVGDARQTTEQLVNGLGGSAGHRAKLELGEIIASRRWREEPYEESRAPGVVDPRSFSIALDDLLPRDKAVVVDSGHFQGWASMFLNVTDPRAWLFVNGFQSVGLGLGAAIGAAIAEPLRITVAAVGDGGLFLSLQELDTLARVGARVLVVVYDDAAYGAEVHHFGPMGCDLEIVRFPDTDLAAIAEAMGVPALTVRSLADLAPVGEWAESGTGPLLVDAKVDPDIGGDWLADAFRH